jgi:hypothetical protein
LDTKLSLTFDVLMVILHLLSAMRIFQRNKDAQKFLCLPDNPQEKSSTKKFTLSSKLLKVLFFAQ